jgi:hypothetical protein
MAEPWVMLLQREENEELDANEQTYREIVALMVMSALPLRSHFAQALTEHLLTDCWDHRVLEEC